MQLIHAANENAVIAEAPNKPNASPAAARKPLGAPPCVRTSSCRTLAR